MLETETPLNQISFLPSTMASSQDMNIEHPNGSEGWLPAEPPVVKQEELDPVDTSHRSSIRRKKVMRTGSTSRHSSQPRESGVIPPVNDIGTTPADETSAEDLKNRAVSANNNLTPKQRSRIAKSEGRSNSRSSSSALTPCFSKGWETHFQNHKRGRKNRETNCRYRY